MIFRTVERWFNPVFLVSKSTGTRIQSKFFKSAKRFSSSAKRSRVSVNSQFPLINILKDKAADNLLFF